MPHTRMVTDHNVDRFLDHLERAKTDADRSRFQRLLAAEVDRFAQEQHRLDAIARCLNATLAKLTGHAKLCERMRDNGEDMTEADALMSNLHVIHSTLMLVKSRH